MKTKLSTSEVIALWQWAVANHETNCGTWGNYPVSGCSYLQFDNNPVVIKFDTIVEYNGESFKRIGWGRIIPGNEPAITFGMLFDLIPQNERPVIELAPSYEFTHPNGNKYFLKQNEYCDYKKHTMSMIYADGRPSRKNFTTASTLYAELLECKPADIKIYI